VYVPVYVPVRPAQPKPEPKPEYWGWGGKLRPDSWVKETPKDPIKKDPIKK
jgi:hypothetical protein